MQDKDVTHPTQMGNGSLEHTTSQIEGALTHGGFVMPPTLPAAKPGSELDKWQTLAYVTSAAGGGALAYKGWSMQPHKGFTPEEIALTTPKTFEELKSLTPGQHSIRQKIANRVRGRFGNMIVGGTLMALPILHENQIEVLDKFNDARDVGYSRVPDFFKNNATTGVYALQLAGNAATAFSGYWRNVPIRLWMGTYVTAMSAALTFLGKEEKISDEEKQRLKELSWPAYMKEQAKLAVDFLNPDHFGEVRYKRQFLGLLLGTVGIIGFFSGRQSGNVAEQYGLLTRNLASMGALTFERDDAAAWTYYSALALPGFGMQYLQAAQEIPSVASKLQPKYKAWPIIIAQSCFAASTLFALFGIQRTPDLPENWDEIKHDDKPEPKGLISSPENRIIDISHQATLSDVKRVQKV